MLGCSKQTSNKEITTLIGIKPIKNNSKTYPKNAMYLGTDANKLKGVKNMLVLTRKIKESIIINDNIKIQILEVKGHQVRIGISAPENVIVYREEIYEKVLAEQEK